MIHILFLILKILGFLILGVLALILILAAILLLSPLAYRLNASWNDTLDSLNGAFRFRWLFRLAAGEVRYENGELLWKLRIAWKRFGSEGADRAENPPRETAKTQSPDPETAGERAPVPDTAGERTPDRHEEDLRDGGEGNCPKPDRSSDQSSDGGTGSEDAGEESREKKPWKRAAASYERIAKLPEKIKYTFQKICDKIKALTRKKERMEAFLKNEVHQNAFRRCVREIKRLLGFLKPDRADIDVEFGFTDPAYTGYTLAAVSILWPAVAEYTRIRPDFEQRIFRGNVGVKGKVRAVYAVILAWNLFWDKNIRTTYRHIKKFKW